MEIGKEFPGWKSGRSFPGGNREGVSREAVSVEIGKEFPGKSYMLAGNQSAASQVKSNNTPRIARKP